MKRGLVVYFEGPDGVGKTTQLEHAAAALQAGGHRVHATRTVGGTPIGELLRQASLSNNPRPVETDLYIALACQHALAVDIQPRRRAGDIILIDRSPLSIIAYQVCGDGLAAARGFQAADELLQLIQPDLILVYHAPDPLLQRRRAGRHQADDYFESRPAGYHAKVAAGFAEAARHYQVPLVDAGGSIAEVQARTMALIQPLLKRG